MTEPAHQDDYPEILTDLAEQLAQFLRGRGLDDAVATDAATQAAEFVREHWGGQKIYIPRGQRHELSHRDLEIWKRWNGHNRLELCREYGISENRLYQILQVMREQEIDKRQRTLF